ncbi:hypothetical protein Aph02nite_23330 [Actinoplanes philippinensis]|uniref:Predicted GTPase n=1 Tax=Actinoplanes philippinensis TaxID=35752 RepID=A0A1I2MCA4_9ACTN|nr:GTPase domain-containing protein [Actinoplanes philippinensis]GIE76383.1 hypothetical protein Aph02nite_23330 [Actinoplanes philippinensis]SFF88560.1 Predicted GTPase [Actinoplanes philippinensis]
MDELSDLQRALSAALDDSTTLTMMLVGKSGVGKSTLVNAIFGREVAEVGVGGPVTGHITRHGLPGVPLVLYDTPGIELGRSAADVLDEIARHIRELQRGEQRDRLHFVLFCVRSWDGRFEQFEIDLVGRLAAEVPVFLVLTQCPAADDPAVSALAAHLDGLDLPVAEGRAFPVLAEPRTIGSMVLPAWGVAELAAAISRELPEAARRTLAAYQRVSSELRTAEGHEVIDRAVRMARAVALRPHIAIDDELRHVQAAMVARLMAVMNVDLDPAVVTLVVVEVAARLQFAWDYLAQPWVVLVRLLPSQRARAAEEATRRLGERMLDRCADIARRRMAGEELTPAQISWTLTKALSIEHLGSALTAER